MFFFTTGHFHTCTLQKMQPILYSLLAQFSATVSFFYGDSCYPQLTQFCPPLLFVKHVVVESLATAMTVWSFMHGDLVPGPVYTRAALGSKSKTYVDCLAAIGLLHYCHTAALTAVLLHDGYLPVFTRWLCVSVYKHDLVLNVGHLVQRTHVRPECRSVDEQPCRCVLVAEQSLKVAVLNVRLLGNKSAAMLDHACAWLIHRRWKLAQLCCVAEHLCCHTDRILRRRSRSRTVSHCSQLNGRPRRSPVCME